MALKGLTYPKTTWSFEERPVASSKLNTWDDRIEGALELTLLLLSHICGSAAGVIRDSAGTGLKTSAQATPGLSVQVAPGYALISRAPYKLAQTTDTTEVAPPTTNPRIDLVQAQLDTWGISVKAGTEAATPTAPNPDVNCLALAELHLRPGMTSIKNTDDGSNGYVVDVRGFL
jgi:hypothetical protein